MKSRRAIEQSMFYGAKPDIFAKAKMLRNNETEAEKLLWHHIKEDRFKNKFRRQHPIDIFIVDFYCHKSRLVIEIDGKSHNSEIAQEYDAGRTAELERLGLRVLRFSNEEVKSNIKIVLDKIQESL